MKQYWIFLALLIAVLCYSCNNNEDGEEYPSIISEFADIHTDDTGELYMFVNDNNKTYLFSNPMTGYKPSTIYRAVCGYVPNVDETHARVYQLTGAHILRDSTLLGHKDPINTISVWLGGKYINMQLAPLSQGGNQYWGFIIDSILDSHAYISLYHNQNGDPTSYTQTTYTSLPLDSIQGINTGDSITLRIETFNGAKIWNFKK